MTVFSLFLALGAGLGLVQASRAAPRWQAGRWVNAALLALLAALIGARLGYILLAPGYYRAHPGEIVQIWLGGLWWPGALPAAWGAAWWSARRMRVSFARLGDALAHLVAPLTVATLLASWQIGTAYGPPAGFPAPALIAPDESGALAARFPLQPLAALALLALFALIRFHPLARGVPGRFAALNLLALGLGGLAVALISPAPGALRHEQTVAAAAAGLLVILSGGLALAGFRRRAGTLEPPLEILKS